MLSFLAATALFHALGSVRALECTLSAFQQHMPDHARVTDTRIVEEGGTFNVPASNVAYPASPTRLRALCAVQVEVTSSSTSTYSFGLFLPREWDHRFLAVGNSGFSGGINWIDMAAGVGYGFASMSHSSTLVDGVWAFQDNESKIDWGYRSLHGSVVIAKELVRSFYSEAPKFNYFSGCSTGGRQAFKEVVLYPDDFDGLLAGAPAWWTTHLSTWTIKLALNDLPANAPYHIPAELFPVIEAEVLRQCDTRDGVVDNIITDPYECNFFPEALLCGPYDENQTECLSAPQIGTLYKIYDAYTDEDQNFVFPGETLGSEAMWSIKLGGSEPSRLGTDYVRYFLDFGADWDFNDYNYSLIQLADETDPGNATADDSYNLEPFRNIGGKLLSYHGLADGNIPAKSSEYFYKSVLQTLGNGELDSFYRHFRVPGLQHCTGTPESANAPWYIAGGNQAAILGTSVHSVPGFQDAEHDALLALMAWTENGTAPDRIIATKWTNDTEHQEVLRQRPICAYPKVARYDGEGDPDVPDSWACQEPWKM